MTIDEAIRHAEEVAEGLEKKANTYGIKRAYIPKSQEPVDCISCAADHRQLAEWLTDYKELKNSIGAVKLELLKETQAELEKRGNMLHDAIAELEEAKRLLKAAVDDFEAIGEVHAAPTPMISPKYGDYMRAIDIHTRKWRYADEALKLIGETDDEP